MVYSLVKYILFKMKLINKFYPYKKNFINKKSQRSKIAHRGIRYFFIHDDTTSYSLADPVISTCLTSFHLKVPWDHRYRYFPPGTVSTVGGKLLFVGVGT